MEELAESDWNDSGWAAWGLTYGVPEEAAALVEEGLLKALPRETNSYTREQELRTLRAVATDKSRVYLQSVVDSQLETDKFKEQALNILSALDAKRRLGLGASEHARTIPSLEPSCRGWYNRVRWWKSSVLFAHR